jgi:hypothetical protein
MNLSNFDDKFRGIKETIKETISNRVSYDFLFKVGNIVANNAVNNRTVNIVENGTRQKSNIIPPARILNIYHKLYFDDGKFNLGQFKLLSSSKRLEVTSRILEEL